MEAFVLLLWNKTIQMVHSFIKVAASSFLSPNMQLFLKQNCCHIDTFYKSPSTVKTQISYYKSQDLNILWAVFGKKRELNLLLLFRFSTEQTWWIKRLMKYVNVVWTGWRCHWYEHSETGSRNLFCHSCGQNTAVPLWILQQTSQRWAGSYESGRCWCGEGFNELITFFFLGNTLPKKKYIGVRMLQLSPS